MNIDKKLRGSAILATIWVVVIVAVLGFALMSLNAISNTFADKFNRDTAAFEAAQAGVEDAMHEFIISSAWDTGYIALTGVNPDNIWSAGFNKKPVPGALAEYSLSFDTPVQGTPYFSTNNITGASGADGYFGAGTVPPGSVQLLSVGTSTTGTGRTSERVVFASLQSKPISAFGRFGIFATTSMNFTGHGGTDAWNSALGTYESTKNNINGNIGTNGGGDSVISLGSHTEIGGNAQIGPGGDPDTSISEGSQSIIYGEKQVATSIIKTPPIPPPTGINMGEVNGTRNLPPGVYSSMSIAGHNKVNLSSGVYVFTGDIQISGQALVEISSGSAIIFVQGNIHDTGQGFANTTEKPKNLVLIGTETCTDVHLGGNPEGYMGIYAPNADFHYNGNADFYGSIVCKTFTNNGNPVVHRDLDLAESAPYTGIEMLKRGWSETK